MRWGARQGAEGSRFPIAGKAGYEWRLPTHPPVAPDHPTQAADSSQELDCLSCGACCRNARNGSILIPAEDLLRWHRIGRGDIARQIQPGHFGSVAFATRPDGGCIHLGTPEERYGCAIYADRGTTCRDFERGSAQCLEFRRDFAV